MCYNTLMSSTFSSDGVVSAPLKISIIPSLLAADFGHLADEVRRAAASGADALHLDIMDAHFAPNLSFGPGVVAVARSAAPELWRHVHLMMTRPDLYLEAFAAAGAQTLQIHVEADCDVRRELRRIAALGMRPALAINPETPVEAVLPYLGLVPEVMVMTVHPGSGGQAFIEECLPKIASLRALAPMLDIAIDGGANDDTSRRAVAAGANMVVAGSHLFKRGDMRSAVAALRSAIDGRAG